MLTSRLQNNKLWKEVNMKEQFYAGFDIHKKSIAICVKNQMGETIQEKSGVRQKSGQEFRKFYFGVQDILKK